MNFYKEYESTDPGEETNDKFDGKSKTQTTRKLRKRGLRCRTNKNQGSETKRQDRNIF